MGKMLIWNLVSRVGSGPALSVLFLYNQWLCPVKVQALVLLKSGSSARPQHWYFQFRHGLDEGIVHVTPVFLIKLSTSLLVA